MQRGVREEGMFNEVEQNLARMGRLERLVLGMDVHVSLRCMAFHCSDELPVP